MGILLGKTWQNFQVYIPPYLGWGYIIRATWKPPPTLRLEVIVLGLWLSNINESKDSLPLILGAILVFHFWIFTFLIFSHSILWLILSKNLFCSLSLTMFCSGSIWSAKGLKSSMLKIKVINNGYLNHV